MLGAIVIGALMVAAYFFLRDRLIGRFTDSVTARNNARLARYLLLLGGALLLMLFWIVLSNR